MGEKTKNNGALLVISAGVLWACIGIFANLLSGMGYNNMHIVALRLCTAGATFALYALILRRDLFCVKLKDMWIFLSTGIISLIMSSYFYFETMELISVSVAVILMYTSPIFVMGLSAIIFKEKLTKRKLMALVLVMLGCVLVTGVLESAGEVSMIGLVFGVISGFTYALFTIFARFAMARGYGPVTITLYSTMVAGIFAFPISGIWNVPKLLVDPMTWVGAAGIGIMCCIMPFLLYNSGLVRIDSSKAAIFATVEPVVATIIGITILGDPTSFLKILGMGIVMVGLTVMSGGKKAEPVKVEDQSQDELSEVAQAAQEPSTT